MGWSKWKWMLYINNTAVWFSVYLRRISLSLLYALVFKSCRTWWTLLSTTDIFSKYWDYFCMFIDEIPLKKVLVKVELQHNFSASSIFSWLYHQHWINHFKLLSIIILLEFEDIGMYHTCLLIHGHQITIKS